MRKTQNPPLKPDERNLHTLRISASLHFVIWGQERDKQLQGEKRNWSRICSIMRFSNSNKNTSKTFPSLINTECLSVHDLMLFLTLNTAFAPHLLMALTAVGNPLWFPNLGTMKKGEIFDFSVYRWPGDTATWGSLVCPLWARFLSYIPCRIDMLTVYLYEWQIRGGKTFL